MLQRKRHAAYPARTPTKKRRITVVIEDRYADMLEKYALSQGMTLSTLTRKCILKGMQDVH